MAKISEKLNGSAVLIKFAIELFLFGVIVWQFCVVRDFPVTYQTRADASQQHEQIKAETNRQLDRIFLKLDSIEMFLRDKK